MCVCIFIEFPHPVSGVCVCVNRTVQCVARTGGTRRMQHVAACVYVRQSCTPTYLSVVERRRFVGEKCSKRNRLQSTDKAACLLAACVCVSLFFSLLLLDE